MDSVGLDPREYLGFRSRPPPSGSQSPNAVRNFAKNPIDASQELDSHDQELQRQLVLVWCISFRLLGLHCLSHLLRLIHQYHIGFDTLSVSFVDRNFQSAFPKVAHTAFSTVWIKDKD